MEVFALFLAAQIFFMAYQWILFRNLKSLVRKTQHKSLSIAKKHKELLHSVYLLTESLGKGHTLPSPLVNIPFADESGLIVAIKKIDVPAISSPFNGSIGVSENGYVLFFRYDTPTFGKASVPFFSNIGCISLDRNFDPIEKNFSKIETESSFSEDARFLYNEGCCFLIYNDLISGSTGKQRGIRIGAIDLKQRQLEYITSLCFGNMKMEKNWTPFFNEGKIHFLYTINPQQVLQLPNPKKNLLSAAPISPLLELGWSDRWGLQRGGTPAMLVDGEYLAFFHSSFEDHRGIIWYAMGAYTFAASKPFRITRMSPHPILFKNIYNTAHQSIANPRIRALYPVGFIQEQSEGKDLIHLSCGENDSAVKIISIDKKMLLSSLYHISEKSCSSAL